MSDIAVVTIAGRLTRDAEAHTDKLASVSIAHAHYNGTEEVASYTDCKLLGDRWQKGLFQYLTKGRAVTITGDLVQESWEDKSGGGKRSKHVVLVRALALQGGENGSPSGSPAAGPARTAHTPPDPDGMDW